VDLLNDEKNKDQSFILKSSQKEENSPDVFTFSTNGCPINKDLVANEKFRQSDLTLRHLKSIKYKGDWTCWQTLLNLHEKPKLLQNLVRNFELIVSNETYFTDVNVSGEFQTKNEKNTLKLNSNIDFSDMNETECDDTIKLLWTISEKLKNIVV
jgi:hypothetical protein